MISDYGVVHFSVIVLFYMLFGGWLSLILVPLFWFLFDQVMILFGYRMFEGVDVVFCMTEHVNLNNMAGYLITERLKFEDIKDGMFTKAILKFP